MRQYKCPVCGNVTGEIRCPVCGWDFVKDVSNTPAAAKLSKKVCAAYGKALKKEKKKYEDSKKKQKADASQKEAVKVQKPEGQKQTKTVQTEQKTQKQTTEKIGSKNQAVQRQDVQKQTKKSGKRFGIVIAAVLFVFAAIGFTVMYMENNSSTSDRGQIQAQDDRTGDDGDSSEDISGGSGANDADDGDDSDTSEAVFHSDTIVDGTLILAVAADYPPYAYIDADGNVAGIDIDIVNEIAKTYGVELEVHDMPFDALSVALSAGAADIAASAMEITEGRDKVMDFSVPYAHIGVSAAVLVGSEADNRTESVDDLLDGSLKIGVKVNTQEEVYCQEYGLDYEAYDDRGMLWTQLLAGNVDCIFDDSYWVNQYVDADSGNYRKLDGSILETEFAFAVAEGNQALLDDINPVIERLRSEGKVSEFSDKHTGVGS